MKKQTSTLNDNKEISPTQNVQSWLDKHSSLLPILQEIQKKEGYLTPNYLKILADDSPYSPAQIQSVATFYHGLRLRPKGKYEIKICIGAACYVKGAERLYDAFKRVLKIELHDDTDSNGLFTVSKVACLGCCMLAPAVQIHNDIFGWVEVGDIEHILHSFLESQNTKQFDSKIEENHATPELRLCKCSSCAASGALNVWEQFARLIKKHHFKVRLKEVSCTGKSYRAPYVQAICENQIFHYAGVKPHFAHRILSTHFLTHKIINKGRISLGKWLEQLVQNNQCNCISDNQEDQLFESNQKRIVTEKSGEITPLDLDEYLAHDGFIALEKVLKNGTETTLQILKESGLRGRGGGGFPTALKWQSAYDAKGDEKYLICNADEGDPGAFMDRMLLESFPYRVLEGMLIAATVIQAKKCIIYIREEYTQAIESLKTAIHQLENHPQTRNYVQHKIELFLGAGAFVCGEESALIESIEGRRGEPRMRPPFPTTHGLFGKPTLINNVETYAAISWIIRHGAKSFATIGASHSTGTKTFALAGKIKRGGLIEVPMGITIREIVEKIGGGVGTGRKAKAVQIGGPSGGCIPEDLFDIKIDFDTLTHYGSMMGSGGLVVLDDHDCMVDIARYFLKFACDESCGKCTPCREGLPQLLSLFDHIKPDENPEVILGKMYELAHWIQEGSLCGLGKTAPNGILTTLRYFQDEYLAHFEGHCPAGKCTEYTTFIIDPYTCIGCTKCAQECAVNAIEYSPLQAQEINQLRCVKCGVCRDICPEKAITNCTGKLNRTTLDFTPPSHDASQQSDIKKFSIDNIEYEFYKNETIWDVAKRNNIIIPKLCQGENNHQPRCMICAVYDKRTKKMLPSCKILASDLHSLESNSPHVKAFRKWIGESLKNDKWGCKKCGKCIGQSIQFINRGARMEIGTGFNLGFKQLDQKTVESCPYGVIKKRAENE